MRWLLNAETWTDMLAVDSLGGTAGQGKGFDCLGLASEFLLMPVPKL